jgi:hypothetical protein
MWPYTEPTFRNRDLRSGKWLLEEEAYADVLIRLFELGLVSDCADGYSLRAYLSRKLHCAPMRISKKYAGRGIGKLVFLSKMAEEAQAIDTLERARLQQTLLGKQNEFYQAIFVTDQLLQVSASLKRYTPKSPYMCSYIN